MLVIAIEFERIQSQHIHLMLAGAHVLYRVFSFVIYVYGEEKDSWLRD